MTTTVAKKAKRKPITPARVERWAKRLRAWVVEGRSGIMPYSKIDESHKNHIRQVTRKLLEYLDEKGTD